ncbi:hypothetical protein [Bradyrhizobium icense]|uniref:Uncharacterized protein n=1 Tax=Bradyrhizobium icense TaxID=1274631 RepID=A0A1B1UJR3_9BRAD|nr:hypothetical protein [Bradyrhizobium icense]ANW03029.1 hypothetical protein LMTR13_25620 [Bradyrhizobium icense]
MLRILFERATVQVALESGDVFGQPINSRQRSSVRNDCAAGHVPTFRPKRSVTGGTDQKRVCKTSVAVMTARSGVVELPIDPAERSRRFAYTGQ